MANRGYLAMHAKNNNSNTNANNDVVVRPTAYANAYGQPSSDNANDGNTFPVGVAGRSKYRDGAAE